MQVSAFLVLKFKFGVFINVSRIFQRYLYGTGPYTETPSIPPLRKSLAKKDEKKHEKKTKNLI